jgi:hypothetical protein
MAVRRIVTRVGSDVVRKSRSVVVVMVEMELDFAEPGPGESPQRVQVFGSILFARKKERVARRPPVGVSELLGELRVPAFPSCHARATLGIIRSVPERLEVVAERKEHVTHTAGVPERAGSEPVLQVSGDPAMNVFVVEGESDQCGAPMRR